MRICLTVSLFCLFSLPLLANEESKDFFVMSHFTGNGESGLHLCWSEDSLKWNTLNDGKSFMTPTVGEHKLVRDPSIVQAPDGTFHMVWTIS